MTINAGSTGQSPVFTGNGVTTVFPFNWAIDALSEIEVRVNGAEAVDFTVSYNAVNRSGTVTLPQPLAVGSTLVILDRPAISQPRDYTNQGGVPADDVERALDRVTRIARMLARDKLGRRDILPVFAGDGPALLAGLRAGDFYRTADGIVRQVV